MQEKSINSFSVYAEYMDLFELLSTEEEQSQLVWKILKYMFYDEIPVLNDNQKRIFNNLKRPLDKSKRKSNKNQNEAKAESNKNQNETKIETHQDVNVNVIVNDNNLEKIGYGEEEPLVTDDTSSLVEITKKVINYLNEKTDSKFKYSSKSNQTKINARLNEGYNLDDFIVVIDKKVKEWTGTEFEKFLCPETLFGTKFEKYLNQKNRKEEPIPDWLDNEIIDARELTEEERIEMGELINAISK